MADRSSVSVIIPCLDEEAAIGPCVAAVLSYGLGEVIVVDGGSADRTADRASAAGARVIVEPRRGYGRAMLTGIAAASPRTAILLFIDGDGSDRPEMIPAVLAPIEQGEADFVVGSRLRGPREPGSLALSRSWPLRDGSSAYATGCASRTCRRFAQSGGRRSTISA